MAMNVRELIPERHYMAISRGENVLRHSEEIDPLWKLHREVNQLFDDVLRAPFRDSEVMRQTFNRASPWPNVEVAKTDKEIKIIAELPGLDEKDVRVELSNNTLVIDGEKRSEIEDKNRWFSERYYGHFERRIPLDWEVEEDRVAASFRNGVLTVTLPKSARAQEHTKRIPVHNGG
jgi:HSP20 family protein